MSRLNTKTCIVTGAGRSIGARSRGPCGSCGRAVGLHAFGIVHVDPCNEQSGHMGFLSTFAFEVQKQVMTGTKRGLDRVCQVLDRRRQRGSESGASLAVARRCLADPTFERAGERALLGKAGQEGDLREGMLLVPQQSDCQVAPAFLGQDLKAYPVL